MLAVIITVSALIGFRYFKNVKNEINKIKKEVINDVNDIKQQRENLNAYPKNDGTLDEKKLFFKLKRHQKIQILRILSGLKQFYILIKTVE